MYSLVERGLGRKVYFETLCSKNNRYIELITTIQKLWAVGPNYYLKYWTLLTELKIIYLCIRFGLIQLELRL